MEKCPNTKSLYHITGKMSTVKMSRGKWPMGNCPLGNCLMGNCSMGNSPLGKCPLRKCCGENVWRETFHWENVAGKMSEGKMSWYHNKNGAQQSPPMFETWTKQKAFKNLTTTREGSILCGCNEYYMKAGEKLEMQKLMGFTVCLFLYSEEKIESRGGEKWYYNLLFQLGKLSRWRKQGVYGVPYSYKFKRVLIFAHSGSSFSKPSKSFVKVFMYNNFLTFI